MSFFFKGSTKITEKKKLREIVCKLVKSTYFGQRKIVYIYSFCVNLLHKILGIIFA
jgi:hypothetical protein